MSFWEGTWNPVNNPNRRWQKNSEEKDAPVFLQFLQCRQHNHMKLEPLFSFWKCFLYSNDLWAVTKNKLCVCFDNKSSRAIENWHVVEHVHYVVCRLSLKKRRSPKCNSTNMYLCLYFDCLIDLLADPFEQKLPLREGDEIVGEKVLLLWRQACCVVCQSNWKQQENKELPKFIFVWSVAWWQNALGKLILFSVRHYLPI